MKLKGKGAKTVGEQKFNEWKGWRCFKYRIFENKKMTRATWFHQKKMSKKKFQFLNETIRHHFHSTQKPFHKSKKVYFFNNPIQQAQKNLAWCHVSAVCIQENLIKQKLNFPPFKYCTLHRKICVHFNILIKIYSIFVFRTMHCEVTRYFC